MTAVSSATSSANASLANIAVRPLANAQNTAPKFGDLLHSEWIKLTSLPALWLSLFGVLAIGFGGTAFLGFTLESSIPPSTFDPRITLGELTGSTVTFGQIIAGILGVMCIGAEYSSGTMQRTLLAAPKRVGTLLAKAVMVFALTTGAALMALFAGWAVTYSIYDTFGLALSLATPGVLFALVGSAVYVGLCAVFGLGLGAIVRSTTVGAVIIFAVTLLGPILADYLGDSVLAKVIRMSFIGHAGDSMSRLVEAGAPFVHLLNGYTSPFAGWIFVSGWALLALGIGAIAMLRRDA